MKQVQPFERFAPIDLGGEFIHGSDSIITRTAKENGWVVQQVRYKIFYWGKVLLITCMLFFFFFKWNFQWSGLVTCKLHLELITELF